MPITCGVPQGSILGPLLFLCYVNDMPVSAKCKLLLYADDSVLLISYKDPMAISDTLSKELESSSEKLVDNRLSLHLGKNEAMLCGTKRKTRNTEDFEVKCKDTAMESVLEVKHLGIKIDKTLSGEEILDTIVKKCPDRIIFLYRQPGCLSNVVKRTLYQSFVHCHLDYAVSSWYAGMTQKAKRKLQIVQNKITRFVIDSGPRTHFAVDHMRELNLLRVSDRAKQLRLNNVRKIFCSQAPEFLQENFVKIRNRQQHTRRSQWSFNVANVKESESNIFHFNIIKDWNNLPNDLKICDNINTFKKGVKRYLLQTAREEAGREYVFQ